MKITLDLTDPQRLIADLWAAIEATGNGEVSHRLRELQDAIHAEIPKPRIPEPGLWGVVEDRSRDRYLRDGEDGDFPWASINGGLRVCWDEIENPVLIREGI